MTEQKRKQLLVLLYEYSKELAKTCEYDCCNCELGILESYGYGHSCAIDTVTRNLESELYN